MDTKIEPVFCGFEARPLCFIGLGLGGVLDVVGHLRNVLRTSWKRLAGVLRHLGDVLETSWRRLGASWERLGDVLGRLGASENAIENKTDFKSENEAKMKRPECHKGSRKNYF